MICTVRVSGVTKSVLFTSGKVLNELLQTGGISDLGVNRGDSVETKPKLHL